MRVVHAHPASFLLARIHANGGLVVQSERLSEGAEKYTAPRLP
jgi:hypothetical protein